MQELKITIVGAGKMGSALLAGLISQGFSAASLCISDPSIDALQKLKTEFGVTTSTDNQVAIVNADIVIFAVKPQQMQQVVKALASNLCKQQAMLLSIAAGIDTSIIQSWLPQALSIVRAMPNIAASIGSSITALYANARTKPEQKQLAARVFKAVGDVVWLDDEVQMNTVTALSGSGPAYFFYVLEALQQAAEQLGLSTEIANALTLQTAFGSIKLALQQNKSLCELKDSVTSKGGTTAAALEILDKNSLAQIFFDALSAAQRRGLELAQISTTGTDA